MDESRDPLNSLYAGSLYAGSLYAGSLYAGSLYAGSCQAQTMWFTVTEVMTIAGKNGWLTFI